MTTSETIKKAIEGGWGDEYEKALKALKEIAPKSAEEVCQRRAFLDPQFWQCLGKAMGWDKEVPMGAEGGYVIVQGWHFQWRKFFDHLAEGGTPESFFKNLQ
jgi:hypothetical protein